MSRRRPLLALAFATVVLGGCGASLPPSRRTSSALDFLYPRGQAATPARAVSLQLPLRVGLAFAPHQQERVEPVTEEQKQQLLERIAGAFRAHRALGNIEVIPAAYLRPGGGFANLDQLRASLGLDTVVLVSYDQAQFTESTRASWTYLTVVGALLIEGEKNETRTLVDAVVYDVPSRALLFRAAGESRVKGRSGPFTVDRRRRRLAEEGFAAATDDLIAGLGAALQRFEQQARSGTVHGPGTPALTVYDASGQQLGGAAGGGALDPTAAVVVAVTALIARRRGVRASALHRAVPPER
jgi:rhombotail lipoprotein